MRPLHWLEHLWLLVAPVLWFQCKAELPFKGRARGCSFCVRHRGHFGPHRTFNGEDFTGAACRKEARS